MSWPWLLDFYWQVKNIMKIEDKTPPNPEKVFVLTINEDELVALRTLVTHPGQRSADEAARFLSLTNHLTERKLWSYAPHKCFNGS